MSKGGKNETVGLYPTFLALELRGINNKCNKTNKKYNNKQIEFER